MKEYHCKNGGDNIKMDEKEYEIEKAKLEVERAKIELEREKAKIALFTDLMGM